ncbi:hypothetical protein Hypma_012526 [Hypsizygus marmoreus]|uniref:Uncharacterized protein n=1 Tax=Hypsizygus marmoreus TaxID=39966 RepID=A0A369JIJ0_HYPMA|nr:hypothetical protein Hypma_012526 [Hypsizygus marmoreus]
MSRHDRVFPYGCDISAVGILGNALPYPFLQVLLTFAFLEVRGFSLFRRETSSYGEVGMSFDVHERLIRSLLSTVPITFAEAEHASLDGARRLVFRPHSPPRTDRLARCGVLHRNMGAPAPWTFNLDTTRNGIQNWPHLGIAGHLAAGPRRIFFLGSVQSLPHPSYFLAIAIAESGRLHPNLRLFVVAAARGLPLFSAQFLVVFALQTGRFVYKHFVRLQYEAELSSPLD